MSHTQAEITPLCEVVNPVARMESRQAEPQQQAVGWGGEQRTATQIQMPVCLCEKTTIDEWRWLQLLTRGDHVRCMVLHQTVRKSRRGESTSRRG